MTETPTEKPVALIADGEDHEAEFKAVPQGVRFTHTADEEKVDRGIREANTQADVIRNKWQERLKQEGKTVWVSPFDRGASRQRFETEDECASHMAENHCAQIEQAILENRDPSFYSPQPMVLSPKRRVTDYASADQTKYLEAFHESTAAMNAATKSATKTGQSDQTVAKLILKGDSVTRESIEALSDKMLIEIARRSYFEGKSHISRLATKIMKQRGLPQEW